MVPGQAGPCSARYRQHPPGCGLTVKFGVDGVLEEGAATEVDELELAGGQVDDDVLVLDVAVQDAAVVAVSHGLQHLTEKLPSQILGQELSFCDEVKEILRRLRTLQHQHVAVGQLVPVEELDDAAEPGAHLLQEHNLHRHTGATGLPGGTTTLSAGLMLRRWSGTPCLGCSGAPLPGPNGPGIPLP